MREFKISCKDSITGKEMVLADCSYNNACDWLERTVKSLGFSICGTGYDKETKLTKLYVGNPDRDSLNLKRTFYYDEDRGILLGD